LEPLRSVLAGSPKRNAVTTLPGSGNTTVSVSYCTGNEVGKPVTALRIAPGVKVGTKG